MLDGDLTHDSESSLETQALWSQAWDRESQSHVSQREADISILDSPYRVRCSHGTPN